jgi:Fur family transcriptional regulator, ferric uptake regulator
MMRHVNWRMFRRSGCRFSDKNMRKQESTAVSGRSRHQVRFNTTGNGCRRTLAVAQPKLNIIEAKCVAQGMRMTEQRRVVARALAGSADHPDVEELYRRCARIDQHISISTVYRTVKLFEDAGIIERHDFREGRARYEQIPDTHHDHLINLRTGEVIEFRSEDIERLQTEIARRLGYRLIDHRLELYAVPLADDKATG